MANLKRKITLHVEGMGEVAFETPGKFQKRHKGLTASAMAYLRRENLIDYYQDGHTVLILLTAKTLAYTPNASKNRKRK